jgi:hypothetical protein
MSERIVLVKASKVWEVGLEDADAEFVLFKHPHRLSQGRLHETSLKKQEKLSQTSVILAARFVPSKRNMLLPNFILNEKHCRPQQLPM